MTYEPLSTPVAIAQQSWPEGTDPLLTIHCVTYNHVHFLKKTLEGMLDQETTFPVQLLIHDDASTDGTSDIVRAYVNRHPDLIQAVIQTENQYSKGRKPREILNEHSKGKYIAMCEGDDYWTCPQKLERQVNYLERNPSVVLSFHDARIVDENEKVIHDSKIHALKPKSTKMEVDFFKSMTTSLIPNLSIVYRNVPISIGPKGRKVKNGDIYKFAMLSAYGEMRDIGDTMGDYRIHVGGVWSSTPQLARPRDLLETWVAIASEVQNKDALQASRLLGSRAYATSRKCLFNLRFRDAAVSAKAFIQSWIYSFRHLEAKPSGIFDVLISLLFIVTYPIKHEVRFLLKKVSQLRSRNPKL